MANAIVLRGVSGSACKCKAFAGRAWTCCPCKAFGFAPCAAKLHRGCETIGLTA